MSRETIAYTRNGTPIHLWQVAKENEMAYQGKHAKTENEFYPRKESHPAVDAIMRWFAWDHLPTDLQGVSEEVWTTAQAMVDALPPSPELTAGLRKLLEAKDCFVRAAIAARE